MAWRLRGSGRDWGDHIVPVGCGGWRAQPFGFHGGQEEVFAELVVEEVFVMLGNKVVELKIVHLETD